jgi:hypothetical protein
MRGFSWETRRRDSPSLSDTEKGEFLPTEKKNKKNKKKEKKSGDLGQAKSKSQKDFISFYKKCASLFPFYFPTISSAS